MVFDFHKSFFSCFQRRAKIFNYGSYITNLLVIWGSLTVFDNTSFCATVSVFSNILDNMRSIFLRVSGTIIVSSAFESALIILNATLPFCNIRYYYFINQFHSFLTSIFEIFHQEMFQIIRILFKIFTFNFFQTKQLYLNLTLYDIISVKSLRPFTTKSRARINKVYGMYDKI